MERSAMSVHDELVEMCRQMHAAGDAVTYKALLERRGRGSRRDIARAINAWHEQSYRVPVPAPQQPRRTNAELRDIIHQQGEKIAEQDDEIQVLREEIQSLERMVRKYRGYSEDKAILRILGEG